MFIAPTEGDWVTVTQMGTSELGARVDPLLGSVRTRFVRSLEASSAVGDDLVALRGFGRMALPVAACSNVLWYFWMNSWNTEASRKGLRKNNCVKETQGVMFPCFYSNRW